MNDYLDYQPKTADETKFMSKLKKLYQTFGGDVVNRIPEGHLVASAFIFDRKFERVLLHKHKIFNSYSAPGGHADGNGDLLAVAIKEAKEEAGVDCYPVTTAAASVDILPVIPHVRQGIAIDAHQHFCYTYLLQTDDIPPERMPGETDSIVFVPTEKIEDWVSEDGVLQVYRKCFDVLQSLRLKKDKAFRSLPEILPEWFNGAKRDLLWRKDKTPYRVWLSEIMLQQTRVEAVKERYERFLQSAPDVTALSRLDEEKLKKLWEGLGYYSRMRNLKKTAEIVVERYNGKFPPEVAELKTLPGIGEYTAGAIASIAFGKKAAAVDGNVVRAVSRVTEDFGNLFSDAEKKQLTERLTAIYPDGKESDFTESLMELGATVCVPNGDPLCEVCPMKDVCLANLHHTVQFLPVKPEKSAKKEIDLTVFIIRCGNRYAYTLRRQKGLLYGQNEFFNKEGHLSPEDATTALQSAGITALRMTEQKPQRHIFTHLIWNMKVYAVEAATENGDFLWADGADIQEKVAFPTAFKKLLKLKTK